MVTVEEWMLQGNIIIFNIRKQTVQCIHLVGVAS